MDNLRNELNEKQKELIQKYTYFLLAASGASIAFALQRTDGASWGMHLAPLGLAIFFWGLSFYFGCRHIHYSRDANWANLVTINLILESKFNIQAQQVFKNRGEEEHKKLSAKAGICSSKQFYCLILGVLFFIIWHVLEIYLKSNPNTCLSRCLLN